MSIQRLPNESCSSTILDAGSTFNLFRGLAGGCVGSPEFQDSTAEGGNMRPFSFRKLSLRSENGDFTMVQPDLDTNTRRCPVPKV
ncbi:hypothetical protein ACTXT7_002479 [Hymenolepis weldensis]